MAVSKRLRYEILRRDNHTCRYCGGAAPDVVLTVDHVIPQALGGSDDPDNLVAACKDCNAGKSASSPDAPIVANVAADAVRWGAAMQYAAEVQFKRCLDERAYLSWFDDAWSRWQTNGSKALPRPNDWERSVLRFRAVGLTSQLIGEAIEIAMKAPKVAPSGLWRYFCGVCWRRLDEMQEIARAHLAGEGDAPDTAEADTTTVAAAQDESRDYIDFTLTDDPLADFLRQSAIQRTRQYPQQTGEAA